MRKTPQRQGRASGTLTSYLINTNILFDISQKTNKPMGGLDAEVDNVQQKLLINND